MTIKYQFRNIAIAVALAVAAALLTIVYVRSANDREATAQENVTVYVLDRSFPTGTTGSKIQGALSPLKVERRVAAPDAVTNLEQFTTLVTTQPVYAGEQLTMKRFATVEQQGIRTQLAGKLRAFRIAGDANQVLHDTLQAGDRVDVVASFKDGVTPNETAAIVLRDLKVLEIPSGDDKSSLGSDKPYSVILALKDSQAQRLMFATSHGEWTLLLSGAKKPASSTHSVDTAATTLSREVR